MPTGMVDHHSSSSSSPSTGSVSSQGLNGSPVLPDDEVQAGDGYFTIRTDMIPKPGPMEQVQRENTLIVHYSSFGTEAQQYTDAERLLRVLEVKGVAVIQATINGKEVEPAPAS